ncbi:MAG: signal peptide peptidase SppA [Steroidobacteraceae bacterium]
MRAFFSAIWHGLDTLRKVLHLLLLLFLFALLFMGLRGSIPHLPQQAVLLIAPQGDIVEELSGDPLQRAVAEAQGTDEPETRVWDITEAIRAARDDDRVKSLLLDLDYMGGGGQPILQEIAAALADFRKSGKKVIAFGTVMLQAQYLLAAQADEVVLDPMGAVWIDGYESYRNYYKDLLERIGVDVSLYRAGEYKSAGEVYVEQQMSQPAREATQAYLDSLWASYQQSVVAARALPATALADYVAGFATGVKKEQGDAARFALQSKLVNTLSSYSALERRLAEEVGEDEQSGSFNAIEMTDYLQVTRAQRKFRSDGKPGVAVVVAAGEILDGYQAPGLVGDASTIELIRNAAEDDDIGALVLRIDSPGGSTIASEHIYQELLEFKKSGKPLVVSMGDMAASGGYYIAAPADEIIASPATITGSIGVFALVPTFNRTLNKLGINVDGLGTTPLSGQARLDRPIGPDVSTVLQAMVDNNYQRFIALVAAGRDATTERIDEIARGRVWSGADAKRLGLVDRMGSLNDAIASAAQRAGIEGEVEPDFVEPRRPWWEELVLQTQARIAGIFGRAIAASGARPAVLDQPLTRSLRNDLERWRRLTGTRGTLSYCFCGVN